MAALTDRSTLDASLPPLPARFRGSLTTPKELARPLAAAAELTTAAVGVDNRRKTSVSRRPGSRGGGGGSDMAAAVTGRLSLPKDDDGRVHGTISGGGATAVAAGAAPVSERRPSRRNSTMLSFASQTSNLAKKQLTKVWNIRPGFEAKEKFRKIVRFIGVFIRWIKALREEAEKDSVGHDFANLASNKLVSVLQTPEGDSFDVKEYISKKEITLSSEVRSILTLHPSLRSAEQVQTALYGLQLLRSFAEYPIHMQEKLAQVAYFQEVPRKRVIIRQGHVAENFYFVLSGYASVTTFEKNSATGESVLKHLQFLRKGSSFGELALLHHERRTSTVVSQEDMHLLTIGRNDFFRIFMQAADGSDVPEHIRFVSTLDIMREMPIEKLIENPDMCLFHFFRRGDVIVNDSRFSEWIYVVKNGTCQVIKRLDGLQSKRRSEAFVYEDTSLSLPKLGTGDCGAKTDSGLLKKAPALVNMMKNRMQLTSSVAVKEKDYLAAEDDALPLLEKERQYERNPHAAALERQALAASYVPLASTVQQTAGNSNQGFTRSKFRASKTLLTSQKLLPSGGPAAVADGRPAKKTSSVRITIELFPDESSSAPTQVRSGDPANDSATGVTAAASEEIGTVRGSGATRLRLPQVELPLRSATTVSFKSIKEEEDAAEPSQQRPSRQNRQPMSAPALTVFDERPPTYIQLDLLKPRDVFGLTDIKFGEYLENKGISVSLVSKGAECVMINKQFLIDNASDKLKYAVLQSVRPYPDVMVLRENFEIKEAWDKYRQIVWKKALKEAVNGQ